MQNFMECFFFRYDESKVGIFIHWGVFSVPSYGEGFASEWLWYSWKSTASPSAVHFMESNYPPNFQYADFAPQFTAELYNANKWAEIFEVGVCIQLPILSSASPCLKILANYWYSFQISEFFCILLISVLVQTFVWNLQTNSVTHLHWF